jgi:uncharacterized OB-fold protein
MPGTENTHFPSYMSCNACQWSGSSFKASCPVCGSFDLQQKESLGHGKIVDLVPVLYPPDNLKDLGQYVSVLVEFDEGFRMFGITLMKPEELSIGDSVVISSFDEDSKRLFVDKA